MWITSLVVSVFALPVALCQSDVRLPPTITVGPIKGDYYRSDDSFTLECKAHGVPEVSYEWQKNGLDLNVNLPNVRRVTETDGTITVAPATSLDVGFYQCIAKNQYGTALSNTSYMQIGVLDNKGSTQVIPMTVKEGDPFCIQKQPIKSNPKPKSTWETAEDTVDKNPVAISLSNRLQISEEGNLCFAYATTDDELVQKRIYKVTEFNEQLDLSAGGSYTQVTVLRVPGGPKTFAPTLGFSSGPQTVAVEGQEVTLRCFFSGNPACIVSWSGPKNILPSGRNTPGTSRLVIANVQPTDEGDYVCTGTNSLGNNQHTLQIRVEATPRFQNISDQPHDTNVTEGSTLTFRCYTYAKPEATVVWLRNGKPLDLNSLPRRYRVSSDRKSLTIENLCRDCTDRPDSSQSDLTIIQCNASNTHGYAFGAGYVNVLLKTSVVFIGDSEISVDSGEEKAFTWDCKARSDPSTPPTVKWFRETNEGDQGVFEEAPALLLKDGTLTIHVIPNKTVGWERYQGKYRCDGYNGYTKDSVYAVLKISNIGPLVPSAAMTYWWIILLLLLILLLILLICICCCCLRRNRGDKYDVDEKERKNGNDPEKELVNNGFQDYQRPEGQNLRGSRGSLGSAGKLHSDDEGSLLEFGDDPGKFTEDGSFVGAYASNTADRSRGRRE